MASETEFPSGTAPPPKQGLTAKFVDFYLRHQVLRFIIVGLGNTAFSFSIFSALLFLGAHYSIANLVALVLGILFSFKTQGFLVFFNSDNSLIWRFLLSWAFIYTATVFIIGTLVDMGLSAYLAGFFALPFSSVASYFLQKHFVFSKKTENGNAS